MLNRLKKRRDAIEATDGKDSTLYKEYNEKVRIAEIDYNYTIYSPLTEKYISLYPKGSNGKDVSSESTEQEKSKEEKVLAVEGKPPLWHVVEQCMADGNLQDLREGKLDIGPDGKKNEKKPVKTQQSSTKSKKQQGSQQEKRDTTTKKSESGEERKVAPPKDGKRENRRMRREKERDMKNLHDKLEELAVPDDQDDDSEGGFFEE